MIHEQSIKSKPRPLPCCVKTSNTDVLILMQKSCKITAQYGAGRVSCNIDW